MSSQEHAAKYEALRVWLGVESVRALIPFPLERVKAALDAGDEHLNTLQLAVWDRQHGYAPGGYGPPPPLFPAVKKVPCPHCGAPTNPPPDKTAGVWGLVRAAIKRDREAGRTPLVRSWSLSDTVCVLKHAATQEVNEGRML